MKKENIHKLLFTVSALLLIGFCIRVGADWYIYNTTMNSAPFSVFILARAVEFLLPAGAALIAALVTKKKWSGQGKDDPQ